MNSKPYRISAISYLNTKPFLYGLQRSGLLDRGHHLSLDVPSATAEMLKNGRADIGLVPVGALPELTGYEIIGSHCIACKGAVQTVCIFSDDPIEDIKSIWLDYQSRTSVELVKILARDLWKISPKWIKGKKTDTVNIGNGNAVLIIGDRAFDMIGKYPFVYDLGSAWYELHQLPFVFACWVSLSPLNVDFTIAFDRALQNGISHLDEVAGEHEKLSTTKVRALDYLQSKIRYHLGPAEHRSMALFLRSFVEASNPFEHSFIDESLK